MKYTIIIIVFTLLLTGCASSSQMYSGPELPTSQTALVRGATSSINIESCDGKRVTSTAVSVLPGEHVIEMSYYDRNFGYSADTSFLKFNAEAGHTYSVDQEQSKTDPGRYFAFIIDVATGKIVSTYMLKPGSEQLRIQVFEKSIKEHPRNANFWAEKGYLLVKLKKYDEALSALDTALSLNPNQGGGFWNTKSFVLHQLGRDEEALADVEKAVKLRGNDSDKRGLDMLKKAVDDKRKSSNP